MTDSRTAILNAIRKNRPPAAELPGLQREWTTYADPKQQFIDVLQFVGGQAIVASSERELAEQLLQLPQLSSAQKIVSLVPGVHPGNVDVATITSPHALEDVDVAILSGEFAVAENGAVWVTDRQLSLRVLYFLCQHLVLVVPATEILPHMHAAYERLQGRMFTQAEFGAFISGPSKTADIEQSLVIGAHGPRSLTVCLLQS